jgi:hypothetical protein
MPVPDHLIEEANQAADYREALEQIADAKRAEETDAWTWAAWAHDLARETLGLDKDGRDA